MNEALAALESVRGRIRAACGRSGRDESEVCLLAVSKRFPVEVIEPVVRAGQMDLGESRQQEAAEKVEALPSQVRWHFIGKLQRNKVRKVLKDFPTIHSVDSLKLATYMDRVAGELGLVSNVYLEVNQAGEERKGGFSEEQLMSSLEEILGFKRLNLLGLMTIPPVADSPEETRAWFRKLRELRDRVECKGGCALPGLSMGMSNDFEVAIEEGSTVVRVGSAIFGARPLKP